MSQDVILLNSLEKLELETDKTKTINDNKTTINPFMRRRRSKSLSSINFGSTTTKKCECWAKNSETNIKHTTKFKRTANNKKLLREPILQIIKCPHNHQQNESNSVNTESCRISPSHYRRKQMLFGQCSKHKECDFKSIIEGCKLLNLKCSRESDESSNVQQYETANFVNLRSESNQLNQQRSDNNNTMGCSHQARLNLTPPCDVTIDELASYFETFVHIPKKMSSMAEMMYI